jgi:DNA-binding NarL/FixJ family response regulator
MAIRIILADDHKIIRDGLCSLLQQEEDIEVLAQAEDGAAAVRLVREHRPDIVVMDIGMPDLNGIEATRQIHAESPNVKIIALSMHSDRRFVAEMLKAGAAGYLLKDSAFEDLVRAIRIVMKKGTYLPPSLAHILIEDYVRQPAPVDSGAFSVLSPREREVLQLLAEGKSTKQAAASLHISVKTVETHRQNVMDKLDIHSLAELTKYAIREGLTTLES